MERGIGKIPEFQHCPVLVESFCRDCVEGSIGRSQMLSEYRKGDMEKNDRGPQSLEDHSA